MRYRLVAAVSAALTLLAALLTFTPACASTGLVWFDRGGSYLHAPGRAALAAALGR